MLNKWLKVYVCRKVFPDVCDVQNLGPLTPEEFTRCLFPYIKVIKYTIFDLFCVFKELWYVHNVIHTNSINFLKKYKCFCMW